MPKFSVIIPAYNSARFVGHAVASAIRQTYRDLEIVVIDDGSSDQTGEIVERCRDSRTRVARRPNGGAAVARNDGISLTDSEFIAFLDADDIWSPRYLQAQGERLLHEPQTAMTFCFSSAVNASGRPMGITFAPSDNRLGEISPFTVMLSNPIVCASAAVVRRSALEQVRGGETEAQRGYYFRPDLRHAQDTDLWSRIVALPDWGVSCLRETLVSYRVHPESSSASLASLESSLEQLRAVFFERHPELDTPTHRQLACGYHLRFLAQTAVLRSRSRLHPLAYISRAFKVSPAALRDEPEISAMTLAASFAQLVLGSHATMWLIQATSSLLIEGRAPHSNKRT